MTYPIQHGPSFRAAQIGQSGKHPLSQDRRLTVCSSIAAASHQHEGSCLIYGPLASILLDQGIPVEYELDEFNTPHTGTTLRHPQNWLCQRRYKIPLRRLATSSLGNILRHSRFSPKQPEPQTHGDYNRLSSNSKHDFCYTIANISPSRIQQCLNLTMHFSLRHLAAKMLSQLS